MKLKIVLMRDKTGEDLEEHVYHKWNSKMFLDIRNKYLEDPSWVNNRILVKIYIIGERTKEDPTGIKRSWSNREAIDRIWKEKG